MTRDQLEELASLHALGLLDGEEKRVFEEHVRADPEARDIAARLGLAAAGLALTAEPAEPPASLKTRVMSALPDRAGAPGSPGSVTPATSSPAKSLPAREENLVAFRWVPWALAASLALVCGLVVKSNLALRSQIATAEKDTQSLRATLGERDTELSRDRILIARAAQESQAMQAQLDEAVKRGALDALRVALLESQLKDAPAARAVAVLNNETQEGVFTVENLPPAPAGKEYQLWIVDPKYTNPVDGGVFNTTPDGKLEYRFQPKQAVSAVNAFAVSLETAGGVPVAQGPMVLAGK
jgi:anti-sigma-K factor RskA